MFEDMKKEIKDWTDEEEVRTYLKALLNRDAGGRTGGRNNRTDRTDLQFVCAGAEPAGADRKQGRLSGNTETGVAAGLEQAIRKKGGK